jgi:hypothetical protein
MKQIRNLIRNKKNFIKNDFIYHYLFKIKKKKILKFRI